MKNGFQYTRGALFSYPAMGYCELHWLGQWHTNTQAAINTPFQEIFGQYFLYSKSEAILNGDQSPFNRMVELKEQSGVR